MQIQAADYPLQVEPAQVLGFDCGLGAGLRICIFFGNKTQNKRTSAKQMSFYFGFRRSKGGSTLRAFNARDSRTAPLPLAIVWAALVLFRAICRSTCSPPAGGQPQGLEMPLGPFLS